MTAQNATVVLDQTMNYTGKTMLNGDIQVISGKIEEISQLPNISYDVSQREGYQNCSEFLRLFLFFMFSISLESFSAV